jgi:hypothetical protein
MGHGGEVLWRKAGLIIAGSAGAWCAGERSAITSARIVCAPTARRAAGDLGGDQIRLHAAGASVSRSCCYSAAASRRARPTPRGYSTKPLVGPRCFRGPHPSGRPNLDHHPTCAGPWSERAIEVLVELMTDPKAGRLGSRHGGRPYPGTRLRQAAAARHRGDEEQRYADRHRDRHALQHRAGEHPRRTLALFRANVAADNRARKPPSTLAVLLPRLPSRYRPILRR